MTRITSVLFLLAMIPLFSGSECRLSAADFAGNRLGLAKDYITCLNSQSGSDLSRIPCRGVDETLMHFVFNQAINRCSSFVTPDVQASPEDKIQLNLKLRQGQAAFKRDFEEKVNEKSLNCGHRERFALKIDEIANF